MAKTNLDKVSNARIITAFCSSNDPRKSRMHARAPRKGEIRSNKKRRKKRKKRKKEKKGNLYSNNDSSSPIISC